MTIELLNAKTLMADLTPLNKVTNTIKNAFIKKLENQEPSEIVRFIVEVNTLEEHASTLNILDEILKGLLLTFVRENNPVITVNCIEEGCVDMWFNKQYLIATAKF